MVDNTNPTPPPGPAGQSPVQPTPSKDRKAQYPSDSSTSKEKGLDPKVPKWIDQMCPGATEDQKIKFYNQTMKTMAQNFNTVQQHHKEHIQEEKEDGDSIIG